MQQERIRKHIPTQLKFWNKTLLFDKTKSDILKIQKAFKSLISAIKNNEIIFCGLVNHL